MRRAAFAWISMAVVSAVPSPSQFVITELFADAAGLDTGLEWIARDDARPASVELVGSRRERESDAWEVRYVVPPLTTLAEGALLILGDDLVVEVDLVLPSGTTLGLGYPGASGDGVRILDSVGVFVDTAIYGPDGSHRVIDAIGTLAVGVVAMSDSGVSIARRGDGVDTDDSSLGSAVAQPLPRGRLDAGAGPEEPCAPNPCTDPPSPMCVDSLTLLAYLSPGTCTDLGGGQVSCAYTETLTDCSMTSGVCSGGACREREIHADDFESGDATLWSAAVPPPPHAENSDAKCGNALDDDEDGLFDCADPSCHNHPFVTVCRETGPECDDGQDGDLDGLADCADPDCWTSGFCGEEIGSTQCSNALDDDEDGLFDCEDPSCRLTSIECTESVCDNGLDDDGDSYVDCADLDCVYAGSCASTEATDATCSDGADNDGDGFEDCEDFDCQRSPLVHVCEGNALTCSDALDNDGDGFSDCLDFDCRSCPLYSAATCQPCP